MPDIGRRIYSRGLNPIPPADRLLGSSDLGPLSSDYGAEILSVEQEAEQSLRMALGKGYESDPFTLPLAKLPRELRDDYTARIDRLTGLENLFRQGIGPQMFRDYVRQTPLGEVPERSPAGRYVFSPENLTDPRVLRIAQQTVRYDHARSIMQAEQYYSAGTFYRTNIMRHLQRQIDMKLSTNLVDRPGKVLTFDVETSGLAPGSDVWQLSARMTQAGRNLGDRTFSFNAPRMVWGGEIGPNRTSLQNFLSPQGATDYASGMKDFFRMASGADYLAGHNVLFDYRMLRHGITRHAAYRNDTEFKQLADQFLNKFYNQQAGEVGNVIDTNMLSRYYLHNIPLARELERGATPYQFSLQNIMLQTNLLERVKAAEGPERVAEWMSKGFHYADVDVPFESHLITALQEMAQGTGPGLQVYPEGAPMAAAERRAILHSRAIGPNINFTAEEQLHPEVLARAKRAGLIEYGPDGEIRNLRISPLENMIIASRNLEMRSRSATKGTDTPSGRFMKFLNRLSGKVPDDIIALSNQAGAWERISALRQDRNDRVTRGFLTKDGTIAREGITPTPVGWADVQKDLLRRNVPMAGMSWMERHLAAALGTARSDNSTEGLVRSVFGADVAPLGKFIPSSSVQVFNSGITSMPVHLLEEWEKARLDAGEAVTTGFTRPGEHLQLLAPSFFEHGAKRTPEMGLMLHLNEQERDSLFGFLRSHPDIMGNDELIAHLERSFSENSEKYGIQVGTLTGLKGGDDARRLQGIFEQVMGPGADMSDQTPTVWLPYAGRDLLHNNALYTMGAIVNRETVLPEEGENIARETGIGAERYQRLMDLQDTPMLKLLANAAEKTNLGENQAFARRIIAGYGRVRQASPFLAGASLLGGYGYYRHRKARRRAQVNEVMAAQPFEQGYTRGAGRYQQSPLATAGLVNQLDSNKIRHTQMGPNKYQYLYGLNYS